jgi:predicted oxidoreductase
MEKEQIYSRVIAGTMTWGRWGKQFNQAEISGLVKYCYELGITTFDHADIYGDYTTEEDFGRGFKGSGVDRSSVQFISKCGIQFKTDTRPNRVKHYDYSKNHIIASVERSLKNLKTDYLDMLLLHRPSPLLHPEQ